MGIHSHKVCSTMKKFILLAFFALLVDKANSSWLRQVSVNIDDDSGCGGNSIRLRISNNGQSCTTEWYKARSVYKYSFDFSEGQTLIFDDHLLGSQFYNGCSNFPFDKNSQFSVQTRSYDRFCPYFLEFQVVLPYNKSNLNNVGLDSVYISNVNEYRSDKWFSRSTNDLQFPVESLLEDNEIPEDYQCPEDGCPINELFPWRSSGSARKQCAFRCPAMFKQNNQKINGQFCYDVSFEVNQLEYCCKNPGFGFPVCPGNGGNPGNGGSTEHEDEDDSEDLDSNESLENQNENRGSTRNIEGLNSNGNHGNHDHEFSETQNDENRGSSRNFGEPNRSGSMSRNHENPESVNQVRTCPNSGCPHSKIRQLSTAHFGKDCTLCAYVKSNNINDLNSGIQCTNNPSGVYYEYCCLVGNFGHNLPDCPSYW